MQKCIMKKSKKCNKNVITSLFAYAIMGSIEI